MGKQQNMGSNKNLASAKDAKKDEFYTQLPDIENELKHYKKYFKNKVIFCNCDDPYESNFFKYFAMNFNHLELKKLICTSYAGSPIVGEEFSDLPLFKSLNSRKAYKVEITEVYDENGDGAIDMSDINLLLKNMKNKMEPLKGDGDFRSQECIDLLKKADIVVTNPPFSLFKEYIDQLVEYKKDFIILGNNNAITYKGVFSYIMADKVWLGYHANQTMEFRLSDAYGKWSRIENGIKYGKVPAITWYTNIDIGKRHKDLILYKKYDSKKYPKYVTFDAIEVGSVSDIPEDYFGMLGVPKTFIQSYNPEQFEIIGYEREDENIQIGIKRMGEKFISDYRAQGGKGHYTSNMKMLCYYDDKGRAKIPFSRILIRRKDQNEN